MKEIDGGYTVNGVVIMVSPIGEYDNRIEILTTDLGRVSAFVRGARRQNSPLSAASMPFTFAQFKLFRGRNSYTLRSAKIVKHFEELALDLDLFMEASYFAEFARYFTRENVEAKREVDLLFLACSALVKGVVNRDAVRFAFEMRMMLYEGIALEFSECIVCRKKYSNQEFLSLPLGKVAVDFSRGGIVCADCLQKIYREEEDIALNAGIPNYMIMQKRNNDKNRFYLSRDSIYAIQYVLSCDQKKLFAFELKEEILLELKGFMEAYIERFVNHKFKSLDLY